MRIILRGLSDTVELRLSDGAWTAGGGERATLGGLGGYRRPSHERPWRRPSGANLDGGNAVLRVEKRSPRVKWDLLL